MSQPFKIIQVSWLTKTPGNESRVGEITKHIYQVAKFLQDNRLVQRNLMAGVEDITDDFAIASDDLTDEGLAVMKSTYEKWLTKVDNGMPAEDVSLLEKALKRVRESR
ncbi:hypothetical protein [Sphingorhabdus sp.]|uniref:hypothetical protein n=1 Tax=Sphingorhabdus sp. TaxID=1902408 RepID=UPI0032B82A6C